jgi:hypothetical protein
MTESITITDPITIAGPGVSMSGRTGPVTLTDRMCEKRVDQRTKLYDRKCPGLYVSINVDGVATFSFRYTDRFTGLEPKKIRKQPTGTMTQNGALLSTNIADKTLQLNAPFSGASASCHPKNKSTG